MPNAGQISRVARLSEDGDRTPLGRHAAVVIAAARCTIVGDPAAASVPGAPSPSASTSASGCRSRRSGRVGGGSGRVTSIRRLTRVRPECGLGGRRCGFGAQRPTQSRNHWLPHHGPSREQHRRRHRAGSGRRFRTRPAGSSGVGNGSNSVGSGGNIRRHHGQLSLAFASLQLRGLEASQHGSGALSCRFALHLHLYGRLL